MAKQQVKSKSVHFEVTDPLKLVRPARLAYLFSVDRSTISRWQKTGVLPPPVQVGGIRGWPEYQLQQLLAKHQATEKTGA